MARPQNPYTAGDPISDGDRFIGRADVFRETSRILRNPNANAIVLHGQRRIGKTSILLRLEKDLAGDEYCPVYFDLQDKAAAPLGEVLYQLAQTIAAAACTALAERTQFDDDGTYFRTTFLPAAVQQVAPRTLVLLFDEFDVLDLPQEGQAGSAFFPYLRAWMAEALDVKFVFVIGRRPEELSTDTLAAFKAIQSDQVSLIDKSETTDIVRLSETNQSLHWRDAGIEQVWHWTQGHPYFTQLLCSEIWEAAYDDEPASPPTVEAEDVKRAVGDALEKGANAFQWIWNGLPPAERIVMAAMAEEEVETIGQRQLTEMLNRSGVRLIMRELELAPDTLEKWDLLRRVAAKERGAEERYRFAIPLLKRWVKENKRLRSVKAELDAIEPLAVSLYQSALGIYGLNDLAGAEELLNRALGVNPNHMQSRLLLGRVHLGQGNPSAAVATLEPAYAFDASTARQDYVAALLARAELESEEAQRFATYILILEIEPKQPVAVERWTASLQRRAESALSANNFGAALDAYRLLGDQTAIDQVSNLRRKAQLDSLVSDAEAHEKAERWEEAVEVYTQLLAEFPDEKAWRDRLAAAAEEADLATHYTQALGLIQDKKTEGVPSLLGKVIGRRPNYKESARYLLIALQGDDVVSVKASLTKVTRQRDGLKENFSAADEKNEIQRKKIAELEAELDRLRPAPTIPSKVEPAPKSVPGWEVSANNRKLILWNPLNYMRLLWWVLVQPRIFKQFKTSLKPNQITRLEYLVSWTISTLIWGFLAGYCAWGTMQGSSVHVRPIAVFGVGLLLFVAWFLTGRYGHLDAGADAGAGAVAVGVAVAGALAGAVAGAVAEAVVVAIAIAVAVVFSIAPADATAVAGAVVVAGAVAFAVVITGANAVANAVANTRATVPAFAGAVAIAVANAVAVAVAGASAITTVGAGAVELGLMATVLSIFWLVVFKVDWPLSILSGIAAGIGCFGISFWLTGQMAAPVLGLSVLASGAGTVSSTIAYVIMVAISDWTAERVNNA